MTGLGVERTPRTAHRPSPVSPAGVSALMPPPSQGTERRKERHAARTGSRWGLRVLVIGGLAGTARPLIAAAHAADRDHAPAGRVESVLPSGAARPVVTRFLQAAAQPLEPNHHASTEAKTLTDAALGGVTRAVRDLTVPIRLTGGPSDSRQFPPVSAAVTKLLRPANDLPAGDGPAPPRVHFGAANGVPALGSGSSHGRQFSSLPPGRGGRARGGEPPSATRGRRRGPASRCRGTDRLA